MAISAKFVADFSSFQDAVSKSVVSLRSFEGDANKVGVALNRMANQFSGSTVIQQASLMVEAVNQIGGTSKLTEAELARLQTTVGAATQKMTAMGIVVPPEIQKIATELKELGKPAAEAGINFKALGVALATSLASTEIRRFAGDVRQVANEFIGAFAEEEAAVKKLDAALQAQGTGAAMAQYVALANEFQRTTTFSDELLLSMTSLMVQVGGIMPSQMKEALTAATNLSAGLGISLEQATLLVAKAFGQGGEQLGKLKAILGDTVPKGADMAAVMDAINAKFGGQATAQVETYTGRMAQLTNQISDFKEKVGGLLVEALTPLVNAFAALPESAQTVIVGVVAIGAALAPLALSFAAVTAVVTPLIPLIFGPAGLTGAFIAIRPFLGPAGIIASGIIAWFQVFKNLDVFLWAAKASWEALTGAFRSAATAITGYAQATYEGVKTWLVDKFQAIVEWVNQKIAAIIAAFRAMYMAVSGGSIVPDMVKGIEAEFKKLDRVMVQPVIKATMQTVGEFKDMAAGGPTLSAAAAGASGGGSGVTVNLTVQGSVVTERELVQHVKESITRSVMQGLQLGSV